MFHKSDTRTLFKWIFSVPYLMKWVEEEKITKHRHWNYYGDEEVKTFNYTARGYKVRLLHPLGALILIVGIIIGLFVSIFNGGLIELWKEMKKLSNYFTLY